MTIDKDSIILSIDPGLISCGYSVLKKQGENIFLLDYGILKMSSSQPIPERLGKFYQFCEEKIAFYKINCLAIETPFLGKNASSFLKLGYVRGVIYLLSNINQLQLFEFSPCEVKSSLVGYGFAEKEQIARFLTKLFPNLIVSAKLDSTDALAVGLCCAMRSF